MFKYDMCGAFDILNAMFVRVIIMFVGFRCIAPYCINPKKIVHTPHKIFLCIIRTDIDRNAMLMEAVLKNLVNIEAGLRSYGIDVC